MYVYVWEIGGEKGRNNDINKRAFEIPLTVCGRRITVVMMAMAHIVEAKPLGPGVCKVVDIS